MNKVQLMPSCIQNVSLETYAQDFSFIVNGEEFKTSRLASDLLSSRISHIHSIDPTIDTFVLNTEERGNFSRILTLLRFNELNVPSEELPFFIEVIQILENESIKVEEIEEEEEMRVDNVLEKIKKHERFPKFYFDRLSVEIEFASSHFFELCSSKKEELKNLGRDTFYSIVIHDKLRLNTEDELVDLINELYSEDSSWSICYEAVKFEHVTCDKIRAFIETYNENDLTHDMWIRLCARLQLEVKANDPESERYEKQRKSFSPNNNNEFDGIINHLRSQSNDIENEINITASSIGNSGESYQPKTVIIYENKNNFFHSQNTPNSWLCIEFKSHRVIPTDYTIRSLCADANSIHLKSWQLEGSVDNKTWDLLDKQTNCKSLNGNNFIHTFHIDQQQVKKEYQYIRIQETGKNWNNNDHLCFNVIEIFGTLV